MKKLHLICNAHLDPVWLWQWKEGAAEAIATFRIAADFCEQYDTFVFNHNEALLYEWVEEYEPALFARIQKLVQAGRWKIMGGWYLQPDCTMLSGESFLSQIDLGRSYFKEKFGVEPKTAVNFDPFGHTRGLVQILEKTGYESYLFMRPQKYDRNFVWEGFAGSGVVAHCIYGGYNTRKGRAIERLEECLRDCKEEEITLLTWGVGNHGGGPSKVDIERLNLAIAQQNDVEILHSTPDDYFREIDPATLPHVAASLMHCNIGCYSSMSEIKKRNRELENKLAVVQKMALFAHLTRGMAYPEETLLEIRKTLAFCQFHDILPGSCVHPAEEDSVRTLDYALEQCDRLSAKAFFLLAKGQKRAAEGEIPIMIYNPHPYKVKGVFQIGFMLQDQNWNETEFTAAEVYDQNGNRVKCQNEKPEATFSLDWIKSIVFEGELEPSCMNRFDCKLFVRENTEPKRAYSDTITVTGDCAELVIDRKTGQIASYSVNGTPKILHSGVIEAYRDNEDPWGMNVDGFCEKVGEFTLLDAVQTGKFLGYDDPTQNVIIAEDGEVRTKIEAYFGFETARAVVEYTFAKTSGDLNVTITLNGTPANHCIKYRLDTTVEGGKFYGQTAFGAEELRADGNEATYHKWCGIRSESDAVYVLNRAIYAGSFRDQSMYITLLRTAVYSAHPILDRPIAPHDRYLKRIDRGEKTFALQITTAADYEKKALVFNEEPVALSYFPHEEAADNVPCIQSDNDAVQVPLVKKAGDGIRLHLFNTSDEPQTVTLRGALLPPQTVTLRGFELKFMQLQDGILTETEQQ